MNKQNINYILQKLALMLGGLFPGVIIFELYFDIGLLSADLNSFFKICLYIIWIIVLSIPFKQFLPRPVENYSNKVFKVFCKINGIPFKVFKEATSNADESLKERLKNIEDQIQFGFIIVQIVVFYLIFKSFEYYGLDKLSFWNIPYKYINFCIVMLSTHILSIPLGYAYSIVNITRFERHLKKSAKDDE